MKIFRLKTERQKERSDADVTGVAGMREGEDGSSVQREFFKTNKRSSQSFDTHEGSQAG